MTKPIERVESKEAFALYTAALQADYTCFRKPLGWGIFVGQPSQQDKDGTKFLTGTFPVLNWYGQNLGSFALYAQAAGLFEPDNVGLWFKPELVLDVTPSMINNLINGFAPYLDEATGRQHLNVQVALEMNEKGYDLAPLRFVILFDDVPPTSLPTAYMKLTALSKRFVQPLQLNLQGIFGLLPNVAWVGNTAYDLDWLRDNEVQSKMTGEFPAIDSVDKFPRYLSQVVPDDDIRILSAHSVRFGAHLAGGTTVMPGASYINFNAGTLGKAMVEGRISSSATIGEGTDVGGGASILGTLSGGNSVPISIGGDCLLGANSVTGIPLGDGCIVDAGVAILAGSKVAITATEQLRLEQANPGKFKAIAQTRVCKGRELSGLHGLHFRVDSTTGTLLASRSDRTIKLNQALHA